MPAARARKSSTSSGRPPRTRPRYLGLEVADDEPLRPSSRAGWAPRLSEALAEAGTPNVAFRIVRSERRRAIVEVEARCVSAVRRAWNPGAAPLAVVVLRTVRTWGTLLGAKAWWARGQLPPDPTSEPNAR